MTKGIPPQTIFWEDGGAVYLVTNWRDRLLDAARPVIIRLSEKHLAIYRALHGKGRGEKTIYHVLCARMRRVRGAGAAAVPPRPPTPAPAAVTVARAVVRPSPSATRGWTGWPISAAVHLALVTALCAMLSSLRHQDLPTPPVRTALVIPPPVKLPPPPRETARDPAVELEVEAQPADPIALEPLTIELPEIAAEESAEPPAPMPEAIVSSDVGGAGSLLGIGSGGAFGGALGARGIGKRRALDRYGGNRASEDAVDAALRWLKRAQRADGRWAADIATCSSKIGGWTSDDHEIAVAMTGLGLLCYLGAGYDHQAPNRYRDVVARGVQWLVREQRQDGRLGEGNYANAIASMALCEAYAMSDDAKLKQPATRGIQAVLARQNRVASHRDPVSGERTASHLGWDYGQPSTRNDSSVTGWNVMAIKSALAAGIDADSGAEGARLWLELTWKATNPDWAETDPYLGTTRFPYAYETGTQQTIISPEPADRLDFAAVGAACAVFLGRRAGDPMVESLANYVVAHQTPRVYPCNLYYTYYDTLALFQIGGDRWKAWNATVRDLLVKAQRHSDDCYDGSWDTDPSSNGRTMSTALACLSLEVYYRYRKVGDGK